MRSLRTLLDPPGGRRPWRALFAILLIAVAGLAWSPSEYTPDLGMSDKLHHVLAFVALGVAGACSVQHRWPSRAGIAIGLWAFGGVIELVQTRIPGRSGEWADLVADSVGILLATLLMSALRTPEPPP
jgi:VanZ family protein